ncbi:MAG: cupin domain-containing protein [Alphaproteobacteria bacterium]|nr:cupin domain-containing protein [Alphaproteobacteria bacterium]
MTEAIYTPTKEEVEARVSRYERLQPMSTAEELGWVGQDAMDVFFARKISPIILDDSKNPFGTVAPIFGAAGTTMFISIMPPGQGPCLHSHNDTFETFMVLEGTIEYWIGDPIEHRVTLNKWDVFSCPPRVYRGFQNVGDKDAVQLTVVTGIGEGRDDVSVPDSVKQQVLRDYGKDVANAFGDLVAFDPPHKQ